MTPVEHAPETATDPELTAVLPANIAGHRTRMCETGFPVNWTSDAGDLCFTGMYDARSSNDRICVDFDEQRLPPTVAATVVAAVGIVRENRRE